MPGTPASLRVVCVLVVALCWQLTLVRAAAAEPDQCRDILRDGIYETFQLVKRESFASDIRSFFLQDDLRQKLKNAGTGVTVGLPPMGDLPPIEISYSSKNEDFELFRKRVLQMSESQISRLVDINSLKRMASPKIVDAWSACMDRQLRSGAVVVGEVEDLGDYISLMLRRNDQFDRQQISYIQRVTLHGCYAVGEQQIARGYPLSRAGVTQVFRKKPGQPVRIFVANEFGSYDTGRLGSWNPPPAVTHLWGKLEITEIETPVNDLIRSDTVSQWEIRFAVAALNPTGESERSFRLMGQWQGTLMQPWISSRESYKGGVHYIYFPIEAHDKSIAISASIEAHIASVDSSREVGFAHTIDRPGPAWREMPETKHISPEFEGRTGGGKLLWRGKVHYKVGVFRM
jgi:hypothetical protein